MEKVTKITWNGGHDEIYINRIEATKAVIDEYINDLIKEYNKHPAIESGEIERDLREIINLIDYQYIKNYAYISDCEVKTYHICDFSEAGEEE